MNNCKTLDPIRSISENLSLAAMEFAKIERAMNEINEAEKTLDRLFANNEYSSKFTYISTANNNSIDFADPKGTIDGIKQNLWIRLIILTEVKKFISNTTYDKIIKDCYAGKMGDPSKENVLNWLMELRGNLPQMIKEKVNEIFNFLRPRNSLKKTNTKEECLSEKVILENVLEEGYKGEIRVRHYYYQFFSSFESLFNTLDGNGYSTINFESELVALITKNITRGETKYFKFKAYKNGNLHIEFTRDDLVFKMNQIAGNRSLKK
jgi:hypothetical protein